MGSKWILLMGAASVLCPLSTVRLTWDVDRATLSGAWELNANLSDRLPVVHAAPSRTVDDGRRRPQGGAGQEGASGEESEKMEAVLKKALEAPIRLAITEKESAVVFLGANGRLQRLATTNKAEKHEFDYGSGATKTRWDGASLVMEVSLECGLRIIETYTVTSGPRQMHVTVKAENWRLSQPVSIERVYDDALDR
jgi:hypothetical protein